MIMMSCEEVITEEPECVQGKRHQWRNPDPHGWAGRQLSPWSPTVTYVRICNHCGVEHVLESPVQGPGGHILDDRHTYRYPDPSDE